MQYTLATPHILYNVATLAASCVRRRKLVIHSHYADVAVSAADSSPHAAYCYANWIWLAIPQQHGARCGPQSQSRHYNVHRGGDATSSQRLPGAVSTPDKTTMTTDHPRGPPAPRARVIMTSLRIRFRSCRQTAGTVQSDSGGSRILKGDVALWGMRAKPPPGSRGM